MIHKDRDYLNQAARDPMNTRFDALPLLRVVLDLAARVDELEKRAARPPAKKPAAKRAPKKA